MESLPSPFLDAQDNRDPYGLHALQRALGFVPSRAATAVLMEQCAVCVGTCICMCTCVYLLNSMWYVYVCVFVWECVRVYLYMYGSVHATQTTMHTIKT